MAPNKPTRLASLLSKIHPPLPMNPRESQQLAKALSKSFQDQLDREHPRSNAAPRGHSDAHISSILANPHFSTHNTASSLRSPRSRSASTGSRPSTLEQLQTYLLDDTLHQFRHQVVAGEATLQSAKRCLRYCKRSSGLSRSEPPHRTPFVENIAFGQEELGRTIANWLWSTGLEESMEFIYDTEFTSLLVQSLYAEGQLRRVESWIERIGRTLTENSSQQARDDGLVQGTSVLVGTLVEAIRDEQGPNDALRFFNVAARNFPVPELARSVFKTAARRQAQILTQSSSTEQIDTSLFDQFAENLPNYLHGRHLEYRLAWMRLKHPQYPDPDPALAFVRNVMLSEHASSLQVDAAIRSHVEVAKALLAQDRDDEAEEVLQLLKIFPTERRTRVVEHSNTKSILEKVPALQQMLSGVLAAT